MVGSLFDLRQPMSEQLPRLTIYRPIIRGGEELHEAMAGYLRPVLEAADMLEELEEILLSPEQMRSVLLGPQESARPFRLAGRSQTTPELKRAGTEILDRLSARSWEPVASRVLPVSVRPVGEGNMKALVLHPSGQLVRDRMSTLEAYRRVLEKPSPIPVSLSVTQAVRPRVALGAPKFRVEAMRYLRDGLMSGKVAVRESVVLGPVAYDVG